MARLTLPPVLRTGMGQLIINALEINGPGATLQFYTGTMPENPLVAVTDQTLLGTLICSDPPAYMDNGAVIFNPIAPDSQADATGVATWARASTAAGTGVIDFDVSDTTGGGSITLNTTNIVAGGPILMNNLVIFLGF